MPKKTRAEMFAEITDKLYRQFQRLSPAGQQRSLDRFDTYIESEPDAEIKEILSGLKNILAGSINKSEVAIVELDNDMGLILGELAERQRQAAAAIDEIRAKDEIHLSDIEAIQKRQLEMVYETDSILEANR